MTLFPLFMGTLPLLVLTTPKLTGPINILSELKWHPLGLPDETIGAVLSRLQFRNTGTLTVQQNPRRLPLSNVLLLTKRCSLLLKPLCIPEKSTPLKSPMSGHKRTCNFPSLAPSLLQQTRVIWSVKPNSPIAPPFPVCTFRLTPPPKAPVRVGMSSTRQGPILPTPRGTPPSALTGACFIRMAVIAVFVDTKTQKFIMRVK